MSFIFEKNTSFWSANLKSQYALIFTSFLFLIIGTDINAQSPGYQGNNVYISYDATPRFPKMITDDSESNLIDSTFVANGDTSFTINLKHTVGLHYIFSRSLSFGVEYTFHQPRYFETYYTADARFTNFKVKATQYGLNLKWYNFKKHGYIAPVGSFWEFRPSLYQVTIEKDNNERDQFSDKVEFSEINDSYTGFAMSVAFGMQTVWLGRLVPSYKMGVTLHPTLALFNDQDEDTDQAELPKKAAMNSIGARDCFISDQNSGFTLDVRIGLGILLF